ncbi:MAG: PEP-CTERM sorting domain-containing protein [Planctomycetota bacterium]
MRITTAMTALLLSTSTVLAGTTTTTIDFESGTGGWEGPQGIGGTTFVDATGGVGGSAGLRTQFNNFGITFDNSTNNAFIGDYTQYDEVTLSIDVKVDQIGTFLPVARPWVVELRDYDSAQGGFPWTSVYLVLGAISQANNSDFVTYSTTITDPSSATLPAGWGGFGDEDPNTFEPILPAGVTFADVLSGVDEIAFTTIQPGFFFSFDDYDVTLDNISITTSAVPAPGALALLTTAAVGTRRRRRRN